MASKSSLFPAILLAVAATLCLRSFVFVPAPPPAEASQLRGSTLGSAITSAAVALAPLAAHAAKVPADEEVPYNWAGQFTVFSVVGYFVFSTALTLICFFSYLILTKLKII